MPIATLRITAEYVSVRQMVNILRRFMREETALNSMQIRRIALYYSRRCNRQSWIALHLCMLIWEPRHFTFWRLTFHRLNFHHLTFWRLTFWGLTFWRLTFWRLTFCSFDLLAFDLLVIWPSGVRPSIHLTFWRLTFWYFDLGGRMWLDGHCVMSVLYKKKSLYPCYRNLLKLVIRA